MSTDTPLVTIITPAFNSAVYLEKTYASILSQTETSWEWYVVNDASQDATGSILDQIATNDPRVIVETLTANLGAGLARNRAIQGARGRFIAFLDADDCWHPEKLTDQTQMMLRLGIGLSYGAYDIIDESGAPQGHVSVPPSITYHGLLKRNVIGCLTAMYDTHIYGKVAMPTARKRQDYGLWLRLLRRGGTAYAVPGTLASYRRLPNSLSANKVKASIGTWRVYRGMENLGIAKSCYYFAHYALGTAWRRVAQKMSKLWFTRARAGGSS